MVDSDSSMHASSFASFVNSTHNLDFEDEYDVIFHNAAVTNILDKINIEDLQGFLDKPVFVSPDLQYPLSLLSAAQTRYSEQVLSQVFRMKL